MNREVKETIVFSSKKNGSRSPKSTKKGDRRKLKSLLTSKIIASTKKNHQSSSNFVSKNRSKLRPGSKKSQARLKNNPFLLSGILLLRITVILIGISTIVGSIVASGNSFNDNYAVANGSDTPTQTIANQQSSNLTSLFSLLEIGQEITPLKQQLQTLIAQYPQLKPGILVADVDNNSYVNIKATDTFASASTIKLPILVAFFQAVDGGEIKLAEPLVITKANVAKGSGSMQYEPVGKKFTALQTATSMITVSDNTATNMIIERLGGAEALNTKFNSWGLTQTQISDRLPDLEGTNTTSSEDLSNLLFKLNEGKLVSLRSRDRILDILKQTETANLLPTGLEKGAAIAHKTGNIKSVLGDTGIVDLPNGQRYIISVLVKRPSNDPQAELLIQKISRTVYQYFERQKAQERAKFSQPRSFLTQ